MKRKRSRKTGIDHRKKYRSVWMVWIACMVSLTMCTGILAGCSTAGEAAGAGVVSDDSQAGANQKDESQDGGQSGNGQSGSGRFGDEQNGQGTEREKTQGEAGQGGSGSGKRSVEEREGSLKLENGTITAGDRNVAIEEENDTYVQWDQGEATKISLSDSKITIDGQGASVSGSTVVIEKEGTYVLEGTLTDGTVQVNVQDSDTVRLVLNGVTIHSETSAPIDIVKAGKTIVSLEEGTVNTLSDTKGLIYRDQEKEEPNGTLFCKGDLTINGSGTLRVTADFNNGIQSKGILRIMEGTYEIISANHGIKGKDALVINGGTYDLVAGNDGMKADYILGIFDGNIVISNSDEGLEGETIVIKGGTIDLTSSDDGINASTDEDNTPELYLMGGTVAVNAEGDGLDANGYIYMSGGQVTVYGPGRSDNGALDYDNEFYLTGGVLAAFGPGGMEQNVSSAQGQVSVLVDFQKEQEAGTEVILKDQEGKELYRVSGKKAFRTAVLSLPELAAGNEYTIEAGETVISFTPEDTVVYVNQDGIQEAAAMGHGGPGGFRGGMPGGMEGRPEFDEGGEPPKGRGYREGGEPPEGRGFREGKEPPKEPGEGES